MLKILYYDCSRYYWLGNYRAKRQFNVYVTNRTNYYFHNQINNDIYEIRLRFSENPDISINEGVRNNYANITYNIKTNILSYGLSKNTAYVVPISKEKYEEIARQKAEDKKVLESKAELTKLQRVLESVVLPDYTTTLESLVRLTLPKFMGLFKNSEVDKGIVIYSDKTTTVYEKFGEFEYLINKSPVARVSNDLIKKIIKSYVDTCLTAINELTSDEFNLMNEISTVVKKYEGSKG